MQRSYQKVIAYWLYSKPNDESDKNRISRVGGRGVVMVES